MNEPSLEEIRAVWHLYCEGDWVTVALWCKEMDAALWDLDGVSCGVKPYDSRTSHVGV